MPSSTSLLPAEVSGASSSQADQPEITVPTLVPGMVAATPSSLDGTKERPKATGRSPEALDWHSCDSSDSMEAAHLQRAQKSQNSTPSHDLVDSRSPQRKGIRMSLPLLAACPFAGFQHDFTNCFSMVYSGNQRNGCSSEEVQAIRSLEMRPISLQVST